MGAAILGANGAGLVQTLMAEAPRTHFKEAIFIHPTVTEGFFTLTDNVN